ncbi:MAG TPA: carboxypeptidase regulatory-like domain-containing protein [Pirellulales bacterium]|nr:carboxypeptidase regulatory-like domain-containing protein [Pirellulales bacterium]
MLSASTVGMMGTGVPNGGAQTSTPAAPPAASGGAPPVAMVVNQSAPAAPAVAAVPADPGATLSGYVFLEPTAGSPNFNPTTPAPGESPIAGATVTLNGPGGTQTAVTDATGAYSFSDLSPGTYSLSITPPTNDSSAQTLPGANNGTAGTGTISGITLTSGENQTNENFPVTTGSQFEQIEFTASLLVSGGQVPLAPYEKVVAPPPTPNVPQQMAPPTPLPGVTGRTFIVAGSQSLPQGGSGGDAIIGGANPASPLYAGNTEDEIWPAFGEEGVNNWLNEGAEEGIMQQLNNLGNMNLLNSGGSRGSNSAFPFGDGGMDSDGSSDRLDDLFYPNLFNFNDREIQEHGIRGASEPAGSDGQAAIAENSEHVALLDPVVVTSTRARRLPAESEWSASSSMSAAAVAAWMLVTGNRNSDSGSRAGHFERRRKS